MSDLSELYLLVDQVEYRSRACTLCRWFDCQRTQVMSDGRRLECGVCRRHAPGPAGFPKVTSEEWCGEFKSLPATTARPGSSDTPESSPVTTRRPSPATLI